MFKSFKQVLDERMPAPVKVLAIENIWKFRLFYLDAAILVLKNEEVPYTFRDKVGIYHFLMDWEEIDPPKRNEYFDKRSSDNWATTCIEMARQFLDDCENGIADTITNSFYYPIRFVSDNMRGVRFRDDPTIIVAVVEEGAFFISSDMFRDCKNLQYIFVLNKGTCTFASDSIQNCPNLKKIISAGKVDYSPSVPNNIEIVQNGSAVPADYEAIKKELTGNEAVINDLKKQIEELKSVEPATAMPDDYEAIKQELEELKAAPPMPDDYADIKEQLEKWQAAYAEAKKQNETQAEEIGELKEKLEDYDKQQEELTALYAQVDEMKEHPVVPSDYEHLKELVIEYQQTSLTKEQAKQMYELSHSKDSKITELAGENTKLKEEIAKLQDNVRAQQDAYKALYMSQETSADRISELQRQLEEKDTEISNIVNLSKEKEDQIVELEDKIAAMTVQDVYSISEYPLITMFMGQKVVQGIYETLPREDFIEYANMQEEYAKLCKAAGIEPNGASTPHELYAEYIRSYPLREHLFSEYNVDDKTLCISSVEEFAELLEIAKKIGELSYTYHVTKLESGEDVDSRLAKEKDASPIENEIGYVKAMSTLTTLLQEKRLGKEHVKALKKLITDTEDNAKYKDKILHIIERHGYTASDYSDLYNECLHSLLPSIVRFADDKDELVSQEMESYLSGERKPVVEHYEDITLEDLEKAIRDKLDLPPDADVSAQITSLEMMDTYITDAVDRNAPKNVRLMAFIDRLE